MLPTLSREAIQMCTLKPIIISNHKWPLSHFLKHFIRRVHRFHSRVNIVKSCMSFEWTLMNSLESALKCSKVFHVFCALYQWSNQKVLCPELRVRHASSLMKIPKCYNVYCSFVCSFLLLQEQLHQQRQFYHIWHLQDSLTKTNHWALSLTNAPSIHCLSLAWKRTLTTSFLLCRLCHQTHWMKPSHPR